MQIIAELYPLFIAKYYDELDEQWLLADDH